MLAMAPHISIKDATEAIRAQRRVIPDGDYRWKVKNTAGTGWHHVRFDPERLEFDCSCVAGQNGQVCWAIGRVLATEAKRLQRPTTDTQTWLSAYREWRRER